MNFYRDDELPSQQRRSKRKRWPAEAAAQYHHLKALTGQIKVLVAEVRAEGLDGVKNIYIAQSGLRSIEDLAHDILEQCARFDDINYDGDARKNARWAKKAVEVARVIAGEIADLALASLDNYTSKYRDFDLIRDNLRAIVDRVYYIRQWLRQGLPPEDSSAVDQAAEVARQALNRGGASGE